MTEGAISQSAAHKVCCSVVQCVAVWSTVVHRVAVCCIVLQCAAVWYSRRLSCVNVNMKNSYVQVTYVSIINVFNTEHIYIYICIYIYIYIVTYMNESYTIRVTSINESRTSRVL